MKKFPRRSWIWSLRALIIIAFLGFFLWSLKKINYREVGSIVMAAELRWLLVAMGFFILFWISRATLLFFILKLRKGFTWPCVFLATFLGAFVDQLVPGRTGYFVRWGILAYRVTASKTFVFSSLLASLLVEGSVLVAFFLLALGSYSMIGRDFGPMPLDRFWKVVFWIILLCLSILVAVLFSERIERTKIAQKLFRFDSIKSLFELSKLARRPRIFLPWLSLSACAWICEFLIAFAVGKSLGIELNLLQIIILLMSINLAIAVPVMPGNLGTMHLVITAVLITFGFTKVNALSFAILFHALHFVPLLLSGGVVSLFFPANGKFSDLEPINKGQSR